MIRFFLVGLLSLLLLPLTAQAQEVAPVKGGEPGIPDTYWPAIYFAGFDRVVASAGLRPLRATPLPKDTKEVRIWIGGGTGYPQELYRFVVQGDSVSGTFFLYWPADVEPDDVPGETFHDLMLYYRAGQCAHFSVKAEMGTCRARFEQSPDWAKTLYQIQEAGLWTLPDASTLPEDNLITFDGWAITVELRDGNRYRTYQYDNPDNHNTWPEAKQAVEIAEAVRSLYEQIHPPDVLRVYRGITAGDYRSPFSPCGSEANWTFGSDLTDLAKRVHLTLPAPGPHGYLIEVKGQITPTWLARKWDLEYDRKLDISTLLKVEPAMEPICPPIENGGR